MDEFWLHPRLGTATRDGRAPRHYLLALQQAMHTLDADPRWRQWWNRSGIRGCQLGIVTEGHDHLRPSADIRHVDDQLRANFTCALPSTCTDQELMRRAVSEVRTMFEVIRAAMALPALPPDPEPADPPSGSGDLPVTERPLTSVPRELEHEGYLTLTQVQNFFG
ncbi:hypothetical protein ACWT_0486 [Actinoplanes sp. SE50]|uniref:hypothetical protein n=1 Tax=unclassified Actinoplanes TaxID=2626549 RepID=UPI00023ECA5E|nr:MULTISPECIES: hypothetical protein [unclassified Actinoplanes]AEV81498.1 hypothetical protein ACPL_601 [Actinoplanes sp. SE50/110]ATO79901.1 hypothetical protein ACWT_0486 [Actinoplanes sp. SE50]SLL97303.1 hypothetical protein ACSP50_0501 [Actinoplanes sp. SE50/110]